MQNNYLLKLLKLEEYVIENIKEEGNKIIVYCHSRRRGMWHKNQYSTALSTSRVKTSRHMVIEDRIVILKIKQRKFHFCRYNSNLWEILPNFQRKKHDSNAFRQNTLKNLRVTNYTGVSDIRSTSKMFPLRLLDQIEGFSTNWDPECKRIGLDGKGVKKGMAVTNITNLDKNEVISVLPAYSQESLEKWCQQLTEEQRLHIAEVCVDMSNVPISTIKKYFPGARIVIDKFHIIQNAIRLMDQHRYILQKIEKVRVPIKYELTKPIHKLKQKEYEKIKPYLNQHLTLKCFWKTIHQLRKVYWQKDYREASGQLRYVIWLCEQNGIPEMLTLAKTLRKWADEILNYYISKTTNAYTEGIHTKFELIKRHHFGVKNMERYAKRILFCLAPLAIFTESLSNFVK